MQKRVIAAGLLGGVVIIVSMFLVNGLFGLTARIDMKPIPAEREVYEMLKVNIVEPGRYICNPQLTEQGRFPGGEPVFGVLYGGVGHEAAGRQMFAGLVFFFLASIIAAWLLSQASPAVLASYGRKVLFYVTIGVLVAVFADLSQFGIASYPEKDAVIRGASHIVMWTLVGLAVSPLLRPAPAPVEK